MQTIQHPSNPIRSSIILKRFNPHLFSLYPEMGIVTRKKVVFEVPNNFQGAIVEYLSYSIKHGENDCIIHEAVVTPVGFDEAFLNKPLVNSCVVKTDLFSSIRYTHCKTQMEFLSARASKTDTVIYPSALRYGLNELPAPSLRNPTRCAVLVHWRKIKDFRYEENYDKNVVFGVSKNGKRIILKKVDSSENLVSSPIDRVEFEDGVPLDDKPALSIHSQYVGVEVGG